MGGVRQSGDHGVDRDWHIAFPSTRFAKQMVHLALDHDYAISLNRNDKIDLIPSHVLRRGELDPVHSQPPRYCGPERTILLVQCLPEWRNRHEGSHRMNRPPAAWTIDRM